MLESHVGPPSDRRRLRDAASWACPRATCLAASVAFSVVAAGCDSGALTGPSGRPAPPTSEISTTPSTSPGTPAPSAIRSPSGPPSPSTTRSSPAEVPRYTYALPLGDTPNAQDDGVVYMHLLAHRCEVAQDYLDQTWNKLHQFYGGPRAIVMFQAGIEMCRGDEARARTYVDIARASFGLSGLAKDTYSCNIFRATSSVLRQEPQSSVLCPGGDIPWWPDDSTCDDPRTAVDECASIPDRRSTGSPSTSSPGPGVSPSSAQPLNETTSRP